MTDFKILSEIQHIKTRPNMYIGSVSPESITGIINFKYQTAEIIPGLVKIIEEIYQNSIDASIRSNFKAGLNISVEIKDDFMTGWFVKVTDDGDGIPVTIIDGKYQAELAWTRARAGSNFDDTSRMTIGMNGIGSLATNAFSSKFEGKSCDGKKLVTVVCSNGCEIIDTTISNSKIKGTTVKFHPDLKAFNTDEISDSIIDIIEDRLTNLAICYPQVTFTFNDKKLIIKNSSQLAKLFHESAISISSDDYSIVIAPAGDDEEFRHLSYFNGISIKNGGSHIDYIIQGICAELVPLIKRKYKIDVLPNQIKQHLLLAIWSRNFPNLKFDSQSKERVTNTTGEVKSFFNIDFSALAKKIANTDEILMPAIESILRKKEAMDKRSATMALKKNQKKKIANHIAANDKFFENKTLFIAEGLCVEENAEVYTSECIKKIKDIRLGDLVMSHDHKLQKVISTSPSLKKGIKLNGRIYSREHRLYVYNKTSNLFEFVAVKDLIKDVHQLVKNRLISQDFEKSAHVISKIVYEDSKYIVHIDNYTFEFSATHKILSFVNGEVVSLTAESLYEGSTIII